MTRRSWWVTAFLAVTTLAVGAELVAGLDNSPDTVPWTELVTRYVPWPVTALAIAILVGWLPIHFWHAYNPSEVSFMARYRKFAVALLGAFVQIAQAGLLPVPATWQPYVTAGIAVATALGVVAVRNADPVKRPASATAAAIRRTP